MAAASSSAMAASSSATRRAPASPRRRASRRRLSISSRRPPISSFRPPITSFCRSMKLCAVLHSSSWSSRSFVTLSLSSVTVSRSSLIATEMARAARPLAGAAVARRRAAASAAASTAPSASTSIVLTSAPPPSARSRTISRCAASRLLNSGADSSTLGAMSRSRFTRGSTSEAPSPSSSPSAEAAAAASPALSEALAWRLRLDAAVGGVAALSARSTELAFARVSRCLSAALSGAWDGSNVASSDGSTLRSLTRMLRLLSANRTTHQPLGACDGSNVASSDGSTSRSLTRMSRLLSANCTAQKPPPPCDSTTPRRAESLARQTRAPICTR
ncbi:hypothetical protein M885DRAFT_504429, partial [Pelagophyceae sp. CCMP2097]